MRNTLPEVLVITRVWPARFASVGAAALLGALLACLTARAEGQTTGSEETPVPAQGPASDRFRLRVELKAGARASRDVKLRTLFPFPPEMVPRGDSAVFLKTVDPETSLEVGSVSIRADGQLTPHISARVDVHLIDLYNRNPTSSDDLMALREAWLSFGASRGP